MNNSKFFHEHYLLSSFLIMYKKNQWEKISNEYRKKPFSCVDFGVWLGVESLTLWDGQ
jgi:hypothetical protein